MFRLAAVLVIFTLAALPGVFLGWGTDRDSLRVARAASSLLAGHYERSRSFGFPLHEALSAPGFALAGVAGANAETLLVTLAGLVLFWHLAGKRALPVAAVAFSPLVLCDATAAIDFCWDLTAAAAALLAVRRLPARTLPFAAASAMLILLRPDNLLFATAIALAERGAARRRALAALGLGAAFAAAIYVALNGADLVPASVASTRPALARLGRAAVFLAAVVGPGGLASAVLLARLRAPGDAASSLRRTVFACWLLYLPRFVALPDQADYLILPVSLTLFAAATALPARQAALCMLLGTAPSLVTLSLFARGPAGALPAVPALQWGALAQEYRARHFAQRLAAPAFASRLARRLPGPDAPRSLWPDVFLPGFVSPRYDLVVGRAALPHLLGPAATVPRRWFRALYACDAPLGAGSGWRGLEAPVSTAALRRTALHCALVDKPG